MSKNKQYEITGVTREEFNQALDIVNPSNQDFINVLGIFVIKLSRKEVTELRNALPIKARIAALTKQDYLQ